MLTDFFLGYTKSVTDLLVTAMDTDREELKL
jgi:hypothetical protein